MFLFIHQVIYPVYFKHLGMSDGLSQVSVMSIYQDLNWDGCGSVRVKGSVCMTENECGYTRDGRILTRRVL